MSVTDMAAEAARKAMETAETVTMGGNAFRAMVAVLQAASGDMLHRHVMAIQAAIETAKPVTAPETVSGPSARQVAAAASNAEREAAKLAERRAENEAERAKKKERAEVYLAEYAAREKDPEVTARQATNRAARELVDRHSLQYGVVVPNAGQPVETVQAG